MLLTGAQIVIECLKEQGVDTVFGYPGGAILNVYDELYKHRDEIKHVLTSHEQGASHAADGYARSTGKVGVCLATSGPGATNLVTGIATAYMDSVPMVAITCNVTVPLLTPTIFFVVVITSISSFQVFDLVYIMTQGGPDNSTMVLVYSIYKYAFEYFDVGKASAVAYILFAIIFVLVLCQCKLKQKEY